MSDPLSTYIEAVAKRVFPQASNNRFALIEGVKRLLDLVQAVTVDEFAFIRSNINGGAMSRDSDWQRLPARLELLSRRLEEEGRYVDADISHQAFEALSGPDATDVLMDVLSHLVAAVSLLEAGGKKSAPSDKMYRQMVKDYHDSIDRGRAFLMSKPEAAKE